jgi:hypothetical protein
MRRYVLVAGLIALTVLASGSLLASSAKADFGIESFGAQVAHSDLTAATQAGTHPYIASARFRFNSHQDPDGGGFGTVPDGDPRDVEVDLPPGLVGNPQAVPPCNFEEMLNDPGFRCPTKTQVGLAKVLSTGFGDFGAYLWAPIYRVEDAEGVPAQFAFQIVGLVTVLTGEVRDDGTYGITVKSEGLPQKIGIVAAEVSFWGVPADPSHDGERQECISSLGGPTGELCPSPTTPPVAFLTNPDDCAAGPLTTTIRATSWNDPGVVATKSVDHDINGEPMAVTDCESVPFEPQMDVTPTTNQADSPTGLEFGLSLPQEGLTSPEATATAHLKRAEVTLPEGMTVGPASAAGLASCSPQQIGLAAKSPVRFNLEAASCPAGSKIGSVEIETPLLAEHLTGSIYLAKQNDNAFDSLLSIYLVAESKERGITVKLAGRIAPDPSTGRLTAVFDDNPQLPFSHLSLQFKGGTRAPLVTPPACGTYAIEATYTPWSGTPPVTQTSRFEITSGPSGQPCPSGQFNPKLQAGTTTPLAGQYSPFVLRLSRDDGTQRLSGLSVTLPKGLVGKLAGLPYCPDSALAGIPAAEGSGAAQLASPSCPAASQVGTVSAGAGAGPSPFYVNTGKAYLAGPYKGAPLSLAIVTPAVAGPFDLGNVVVRTALQVNPETAQITAVSDPIPTIVHGIPLDLRDVRVNVDRDGFTLNPTSCEEMAFSGSATSPSGASASLGDRFQVASCASLAFAPKLALSVKGGHRRGAYQRLKAVLTAKPGQANIGKVSVALPHSEFLAQEHIKTICTRVQYAADACPAGSIYGQATAWSPLLDQPLSGPVYLRSSSHPLPDLVAALHGQIDIDLAGRIDSVNGGIRNTFETVPDAPVSKFVLEMKGGKKSLLVNSRNLCAKGAGKATVKMDGQNGKTADQSPALATSCRKGRRR